MYDRPTYITIEFLITIVIIIVLGKSSYSIIVKFTYTEKHESEFEAFQYWRSGISFCW